MPMDGSDQTDPDHAQIVAPRTINLASEGKCAFGAKIIWIKSVGKRLVSRDIQFPFYSSSSK